MSPIILKIYPHTPTHAPFLSATPRDALISPSPAYQPQSSRSGRAFSWSSGFPASTQPLAPVQSTLCRTPTGG